MYVVFVKFLKFTDGTPTYPIILLLGISLWSFFTEATTVGMQSIVGRGDILRKINFPKYIIILSSMFSALISLFINIIVVLIFAIFTGVKLSWLVLWLPMNFLQLFVLALGISLFLSTLYVKFRDIGHIYEVILQIVFYSAPIIYPLSQVANFKVFGISAQNIIMLNPIAQIIQDIRHNLIAPATTRGMGGILYSLVPIIITIVILIIGVLYFNKNSKKFAEMI